MADTEVRVKFVTDTKELDAAKRRISEFSNSNGSNSADQAKALGNAFVTVADKIADWGKALNNVGDTAGAISNKVAILSTNTSDAGNSFEDLGEAVQGVGSNVQELDDAAEGAGSSVEFLGNALQDAASVDFSDTTEQVSDLRQNANDATQCFTDISNELETLKSYGGDALLGVSERLVSLGQDCIAASGEFEQLRAKLVTIQHDSKAAESTFNYAKTLAASTPFDVKGVVAAAVQLEVYGQNSRELLPVVANLASAMGGDITHAATAMGRALSGSSEGLQSLRDVFGVNTAKLTKFGAEMNAQGGIAVDTAENVAKLKHALVELVNTEFAGGIERQAATVAGSIGNLEDEITNAKAAIGDEFAPYIKVLSEQAAGFVATLGGMAPVIAILGGTTAAVAALSGGLVTALASAVAFKSAMDRLGVSVSAAKAKMAALNSGSVGIAMRGGGYLGMAFSTYEAVNLYVEKRIADEKKAQAVIADQTKALQNQRQTWNSVRQAIEEATGAKIKFNGKDTTAGAVDITEILEQKNLPISTILDNLSAQGVNEEAVEDALQAAKSKRDTDKAERKKVLADLLKVDEEIDYYKQQGRKETENPLRTLIASRNELRAQSEQLKNSINTSNVAQIESFVERYGGAMKAWTAAQNQAAADSAFGQFAENAEDAGLLYSAIERCRKSLAGLYDTARGITHLNDHDLKDGAARMDRMADLIGKGQQNGKEYKILATITEQESLITKFNASLDEQRHKRLEGDLQALDLEFARKQAGHDRDIAAEQQLFETKLEQAKQYRQALAQNTAEHLNTRQSWLPGEQEELRQKLANLQQLSTDEIDCINKLHEIEKSQAIESLNSSLQPVIASAEQLAGSVLADPGDVVRAYDTVIAKLHAWADANQNIMSSSKDVRESYSAVLKAQEQARQASVERQGNSAFVSLQSQAQNRMANASGPMQQLEVVRETVRQLQTALRVNQEIKASESARAQVQQQIKVLAQQELSFKQQISQLEQQMADETQSVQIQLERERLTALQDRLNAGENVQAQIAAQQQKIYELELQQLYTAEEQKLKAVEGSEKAQLEVRQQYGMKREMLELRFNRTRGQNNPANQKPEGGAFGSNNAGVTNLGSSHSGAGTAGPTTSWKPGSPLMSMSEALDSHNNWFAQAGMEPLQQAATTTASSITSLQQATTTTAGSMSSLSSAAASAAGALASLSSAPQAPGAGGGATSSPAGASATTPSTAGAAATTGGALTPSTAGTSAATLSMPTPAAMGAVTNSPGSSVTGGTTSATTNNYYMDGIRQAADVNYQAMARAVAKVASQEARRTRTMMGG